MQIQYINLFNQAKQYRSNNPFVTAIVLLCIIVLIPIAIVVALGALVVFMVYAQVKTFVRSLTRSEKQPRIKVTTTSKSREPEYAQYEIIEEQTNKPQ